jgi:hypothetical protein
MLYRRHSRQARLAQTANFGQTAQVVSGVATVQELAEPWSSKTFVFHSLEGKENVSSIVISLAGRPTGSTGFLPRSRAINSSRPKWSRCWPASSSPR